MEREVSCEERGVLWRGRCLVKRAEGEVCCGEGGVQMKLSIAGCISMVF